MVRSLGIAAVVMGLAWTGLVGAQPSSAPPPGITAAAPERFITVREEGKPPTRCKLLKTWQDASGATAFQVQAVESGEVMTLLQYGPASASGAGGARTMPTRIFHSSGDKKPPANAPVPPIVPMPGTPPTAQAPPVASTGAPHAVSVAPPLSAPTTPTGAPRAASVAPPLLAPAPGMTGLNPSPRVIKAPQPALSPVPGLKSETASLTSRKTEPTPPAPASVATSSQPVAQTTPNRTNSVAVSPQTNGIGSTPVAAAPGGAPTVLPPPAPPPPPACDCSPCNPSSPRLMPQSGGTVVSQTPCDCRGESSCTCCTPPTRQRWLGRLFKPKTTDSAITCCPSACSECNPTTPTTPTTPNTPAAPFMPPATAAPKPPSAQAAGSPAPTRDWRESWGKVEPWKATAQAENGNTDSAPTKQTARAPAPINAPAQPDPLSRPDLYHDMALKGPAGSKPADTPVVASIAAPPMPPGASEKAPLVESVPPAPSPQGPPSAPPAGIAAAPSPVRPKGPGIELSANEGNAFWTPPPPTPPQAPQAPKYNAFTGGNAPPPQNGMPMGGMPMGGMPMGGMPMGGMPMGGMPMGGMPMGGMPMPMPSRPPMPPPVINSGVPSGMANAFTLAGTRRPIPADFGPTPQEPNGFGDAVPYMPAQGPSVPPRQPMLPPSPGMLGYMQPPMPPMQGMPGMPGMPPMSGMMPQASAMMINPLMAVPPSSTAQGRLFVPMAPANVPQMLVVLRDSQYPSEREVMADHLAELNWHMQPQVVASLAKTARDDPAATVRAACVRALAHMKVNTTDVVAVVQDLKNDRDARVRHEADEALGVFGVASSAHPDAAIQQASHK